MVLWISQSANAGIYLSTIQRIDVNAHIGDIERTKDYVEVGEILKEKYKVNLEIWIDLNFHRQSDTVLTPQNPILPKSGIDGHPFFAEKQNFYIIPGFN